MMLANTFAASLPGVPSLGVIAQSVEGSVAVCIDLSEVNMRCTIVVRADHEKFPPAYKPKQPLVIKKQQCGSEAYSGSLNNVLLLA
jgi:hypothetical protein